MSDIPIPTDARTPVHHPLFGTTIAIDTDPEFFHGLTMFGPMFAQIRQSEVVIGFLEGTPRSTEDGHPHSITLTEARRLRDLLNVATARGFL